MQIHAVPIGLSVQPQREQGVGSDVSLQSSSTMLAHEPGVRAPQPLLQTEWLLQLGAAALQLFSQVVSPPQASLQQAVQHTPSLPQEVPQHVILQASGSGFP